MKRLLTLLLALAMGLSLAACGAPAAGRSADASPAAETGDPAAAGLAYGSSAVPLPEEANGIMCLTVSAPDGTICLGDGDNVLWVLDTDGTVRDRFLLSKAKGAIKDLCPAGDGTLWILTVPQPVPQEPSQVGACVCRFDPVKGQVLDDFELFSVGGVPSAIRADTAGQRLYIATDTELLALDHEGTELFRLPGTFYDLSMAEDGTLAALDVRLDSVTLLTLGGDKKDWERTMTFHTQAVILCDGGQGRDLLISEDGTLCGLDLAGCVSTPLLDLDQANVFELSGAFALPDGQFLLLDSYGPTLYLARPGAEPELVTVAVLGESVLTPAVIAFNNSQDEYRVVLKDYGYNAETGVYYDSYDTAALTQLGLDIASGDGPDVLALDALPIYQYIREGLLEDLYPYIDADPDLDREDLDGTILAAMETDGALYELTPVVQLRALVSAPGALDGLEPLRWSGLLERFGEGALAADGGIGPLAYAVCGDDSPFIDWENNTCEFENDEFLALLALTKGPEGSADSAAPSILPRSVFGGPGLVELAQQLALEDQAPALYGLPGRDGDRYLLAPLIDFGIMAQSAHKDGAWAFLRTLLTEPSTAWLGRSLVLGAETGTAYAEAFDSVPETYMAQLDEAADAAFAAANGAYHQDMYVVAILREETAPYFAGQATAEDTAASVQNRVRIYLSERG